MSMTEATKRHPLGDKERLDWLRLARSTNVGPRTFDQLIAVYGTPGAALDALPGLAGRSGGKRRITLCTEDAAERELEQIRHLGARLVASCEDDYPDRLRHIDSNPPIFCMAGDAGFFTRPTIGIVGARNASAAGCKIASVMAHDLGTHGFVIASGLARGIDTAAHTASLDSGTIAVIAGGLDIVYPPENSDLQRSIGECGIVMTEMSPGVRPQAKHFPRRNRIISGLSQGVLVIEAAERSGSLITARYAAEQGREVFAVPGSPLDPRAAGTNRLIREGALLTGSAEDIVEALSMTLRLPEAAGEPAVSPAGDPDLFSTGHSAPAVPDVAETDRERIVSLLGPAPVSIDDLIEQSGLEVAEVQMILLEIDLAGRLQRHGNAMVSILI